MILSETITLPLPNILGPCPYKTGPNETTRKMGSSERVKQDGPKN